VTPHHLTTRVDTADTDDTTQHTSTTCPTSTKGSTPPRKLWLIRIHDSSFPATARVALLIHDPNYSFPISDLRFPRLVFFIRLEVSTTNPENRTTLDRFKRPPRPVKGILCVLSSPACNFTHSSFFISEHVEKSGCSQGTSFARSTRSPTIFPADNFRTRIRAFTRAVSATDRSILARPRKRH
jgi:hypothetical protein